MTPVTMEISAAMTNTTQTEPTYQLSHEDVMRTVNAIPPLPPSVVQLNKIFSDPNYEFADLVRAVELDASLSGKLLRLANSARRCPGGVGSIREAVVQLGSGTVKSVAMAHCVRPQPGMDLSAFDMTPESYWKHSVTVVCYAEELMAQGVAQFGDEFSVAALLHDYGKIVLVAHLTPEHCSLLHQIDLGISAPDLERAILSIDHAEVSAVVAREWNLPEQLVNSIQHHHRPNLFDHPLCHGLNVANQLAQHLESTDDDRRPETIARCLSTEALRLTPDRLKDVSEQGAVRLKQALEAYT
ncbi:MAG: HDOD domain-containing protein [Fuerstiella sp.]|nr:HDOD domain-containing protein [Fuerstiella sp.]